MSQGDLLPVLYEGCPEAHGPLLTIMATQGSLFIHGGYGGLRRTTWRICPTCWWSLETAQDEINPRTW